MFRFGDRDKAEVRRILESADVETIEHAILLGCSRKLKALINGEGRGSLIRSFCYFADIIQKVNAHDPGPGYWAHVESWLKRCEPMLLSLQAEPVAKARNMTGPCVTRLQKDQ